MGVAVYSAHFSFTSERRTPVKNEQCKPAFNGMKEKRYSASSPPLVPAWPSLRLPVSFLFASDHGGEAFPAIDRFLVPEARESSNRGTTRIRDSRASRSIDRPPRERRERQGREGGREKGRERERDREREKGVGHREEKSDRVHRDRDRTTAERTNGRRSELPTRKRDDLIIGPACTLTNFRESVVKGAEKPESRAGRGKG